MKSWKREILGIVNSSPEMGDFIRVKIRCNPDFADFIGENQGEIVSMRNRWGDNRFDCIVIQYNKDHPNNFLNVLPEDIIEIL